MAEAAAEAEDADVAEAGVEAEDKEATTTIMPDKDMTMFNTVRAFAACEATFRCAYLSYPSSKLVVSFCSLSS